MEKSKMLGDLLKELRQNQYFEFFWACQDAEKLEDLPLVPKYFLEDNQKGLLHKEIKRLQADLRKSQDEKELILKRKECVLEGKLKRRENEIRELRKYALELELEISLSSKDSMIFGVKYQDLFDHLVNQHNLTLTENDIQEIVDLVKNIY